MSPSSAIGVTVTCPRGCSIRNRRRPGPSGRNRQRSSKGRPLDQTLPDLAIERISHDGRGIGHWQGKTLFVEGALPGETVTARLLREQARFGEAVAETIAQPAPERASAPCIHYDRCGGCQLQHIATDHQLVVKETAVLEQLQRWAGLAPRERLAPIQSASSGYRGRARLGVWYERDGSVTLGFRQRRRRELTPIDRCVVLEPILERLLTPLHQWLRALHSRGAITHVELIAAAEGAAVVLRQVKPLAESDRSALADLARTQECRVWLQDTGDGPLKDASGQACDPRLSYHLPHQELTLGFHPGDFTQVNQPVNRLMVARALDLLQLSSEDRVLDLFCGIGNFTLALARHCGQVVGVEAAESMVARGRENAARAGLENVQFIAADLARLSGRELRRRCGRISALLLDPPREGAREILEAIGQLGPNRVVYVSCNPATLARDAGILAENGYRLQSLGVLDMFPHTAHVESMALFVRV